MTETKKNPGMARLIIVLFIITAVSALCLGFVNHITSDRIADIKAEKTASAMQEVLPADEYLPVQYEGDELVAALYQANAGGDTIGYVVEVTPSGFGGTIDMMVGVDFDGAVTGVAIISMSETSGLGANASREDFRSQYLGGTGGFAVTKDGGEIQALTGATVTSRAVTRGVNAAAQAAASLKG